MKVNIKIIVMRNKLRNLFCTEKELAFNQENNGLNTGNPIFT